MTIAFRILWSIDVLVACVAAWFFVVGLADGSVSSFNFALWLAVLGAVAAVVWGSRALERAGRTRQAIGVSLVLALPALGFALILTVATLSGARWN
jgi:multisubunit Na+/H+ antiporter MnhF subunit